MTVSMALRWLWGWVSVEAEGGYPERMLNDITTENLSVWGVQRQREYLRFCCFARDYRRFRPLARRACVRMRMRRKHGLPFWLFRYRHRRGLLVGLAVYVLVMSLLAPRIWVVQVVGNTTTAEKDILSVAADMGVQIGAPMKQLQIKTLEIDGLRRLPTLSWVTVNPTGCVARVEVAERKPTPEVLDLSRPSDIVALRDGRILRMEVRSGDRVVKDGEAVKAGGLLISGRRQTEQGERLYRSYGEVWAQTRRTVTVAVPLVYRRQEADGYVALRPTVTFLRWQIPLYGSGTITGNFGRRTTAHFLQARGMRLPLGITNEYFIRMREVTTARTVTAAAALAAEQLRAEEAALFAPNSYEEISRTEETKDGNYLLQVTYSCVENIAVEVPIN